AGARGGGRRLSQDRQRRQHPRQLALDLQALSEKAWRPDGRRVFLFLRSERDFVVELLVEGAAASAAERARASEIAGRRADGLALAARSLAAVEQGQLTTILLQHDLCRIAVLAGLVLPFACLELPFEVNLRTLLEILLGDLCKILVEDDDAVPFGALAPLAASFDTPALARCHAQIDD